MSVASVGSQAALQQTGASQRAASNQSSKSSQKESAESRFAKRVSSSRGISGVKIGTVEGLWQKS